MDPNTFITANDNKNKKPRTSQNSPSRHHIKRHSKDSLTLVLLTKEECESILTNLGLEILDQDYKESVFPPAESGEDERPPIVLKTCFKEDDVALVIDVDDPGSASYICYAQNASNGTITKIVLGRSPATKISQTPVSREVCTIYLLTENDLSDTFTKSQTVGPIFCHTGYTVFAHLTVPANKTLYVDGKLMMKQENKATIVALEHNSVIAIYGQTQFAYQAVLRSELEKSSDFPSLVDMCQEVYFNSLKEFNARTSLCKHMDVVVMVEMSNMRSFWNLCYTSFKRIVSNMSLKTIQKDEHTLAQISSFSEDKLSKLIWDKILRSCHGVDGNNVDGSASSL